MVQITLTLKSNRPSTVYSYNGKSYRLQPGSNTLNLEYEDYVALAKALSIKPIAKDGTKPTSSDTEHQQAEPVKEEPIEEKPEETPVVDELIKEDDNKEADKSVEEVKEELVKEPEDESIDYSSWSVTKLKAEYKAITGTPCKLKKDEIIAFLQEHNNA